MNIYIGGPIIVDDYTAMQGPAPDGFHVPLITEWQGLKTIMDGLGLTTGASWRINLHMPFAGAREDYAATLYDQGSQGYYWSSSPRVDSTKSARNLYIGPSSVNANFNRYRARGLPVRCLKDSYEEPTSSWTVINGTLGSAGIFWNQTKGLISITDGTTGYTMQDKNLGATTVYNDGNTLTQANMGKMYQWGNNYGFPSTGDVTTSSTQVNAGNYGPGNYYSGSTFIYRNNDRSSVQNDNLRGGVTGVVQKPEYQEVKNMYIGEYVPPYLCFTANTAGSTVKLKKNGSPTTVTLETSTDGWNWDTYTIGTDITLTNIGDKVYFRNTSETDTGFSGSVTNSYYYGFVMTGSIAGSGDVMFLLNKNGTATASTNCFQKLFLNCTSLTTSPKLGATTIGNYSYNQMFSGCSNLTTAPSLPATTIGQYAYQSMFINCTSLTTAPSLPATSVGNQAYRDMFSGCTNLEVLPLIRVVKIPTYCCYQMFKSCSKIKISDTQTGEYQTPYRIPNEGTGTVATRGLLYMFNSTGGTYTSDPVINTTYYTSNTVV